MKKILTQLNINPKKYLTGFTTTSEGENTNALLRQARSKIKQDSDFLGAPPEKNRPQAGFTLIETIVAMTVLLVSITGIMNLIHQGSVANRQQADQITATYLAAEAIEFVRARRDAHWLQSGNNTFQDWAINAGDAQSCQYSCVIDSRVGINEVDKIDLCGGNCPPLNYNVATQQYGYDTGSNWEDSRFTRSVTIDLNNNTGSFDEAEITVTVSWQAAGSSNNSITVQQSIYDYRGN